MKLNERQKTVILEVLEEVLYRMDNPRHHFGSETIEEMLDITSRIRTEPYCKRNGIRYEDLTDDDRELMALEEIERDEAMSWYDDYAEREE